MEDRTLAELDNAASRSVALDAARVAEDKKASQIVILDVGDLLGVTEFFVIASASNPRQLGTVIDEVQRVLKADGHAPLRREGTADDGWLVVDYGDIVVHVFTQERRGYYDLERLWADAPRLEIGAPVA